MLKHPDSCWDDEDDVPAGLCGGGLPLTEQSKKNISHVLKNLFAKMNSWREKSKTEKGYPPTGTLSAWRRIIYGVHRIVALPHPPPPIDKTEWMHGSIACLLLYEGYAPACPLYSLCKGLR